jgi:AcrR family transcriptional regulator
VPGDLPHSARARYLRIATELATRQQGGRNEVPYLAARVQLADIAAAVGRTRTALYRQWETQHDFWVDLTVYLAYQDDLTQTADDMPWHGAAQALAGRRVTDDEAVELVRVFGNAGHAQLDDNPWFLVRAGLLGYPDVADLAEVRRQVEQRRIALLAAFAEEVLTSIGRTPDPPFTSDDLATILWCGADAQRVRRHFLPDHDELWWLRIDEAGGVQDWSLWAFMSRAVLFDLTRPAAAEAGGVRHDPPAMTPIMDPLDRWNALQRQALAAATDVLLADLLASPAAGGAVTHDEATADRTGRDLGVLGHVTIARVATAAGVSRRAVYDVWPTRTDMILDVLRREVAARRAAMVDAFTRALRAAGERIDVPSLIDALVTASTGDRAPAPDIVLAFIPAASDLRVRAIIAAGHDRYLAECADRIELLMHAAGRRLRRGVEREHVALLWLILIEGGRRLRRTNPAALRPSAPGRPSALGAAALAVFRHASEPTE